MAPEICCPINQLATTRHIPFNKAENIEEFFQPASGKPDPEPILVLAYIPDDTWPDTDFHCSFHTIARGNKLSNEHFIVAGKYIILDTFCIFAKVRIFLPKSVKNMVTELS